MAKVYKMLEHATFLLPMVSSISITCFRLNPYSSAGKIDVYSSLAFELVETCSPFMTFVKFPIASLLNLIIFCLPSLMWLSLVI